MKLEFIPIDKLAVAKINMRHGKEPDISDILPSVRKRGVLQSILVRPLADSDLFEVVAGNRRRRAAFLVARERQEAGEGEPVLVPAGILEPGDAAAALEASMLENFARLAPDEVSQWEAFVRLVKEGRTPEDIGTTFCLPDLRVKRILALAISCRASAPSIAARRLMPRPCAKRKGGRVYIEVRSNGEISCHEGYLTEKEANRAAKSDQGAAGIKAVRPEISSTLATYIDLHRHAAARAALLTRPDMALRMMVAHAIVGSPLWSLRVEPQTSRNEETKQSLSLSPGQFLFDERRREMLDLLGLSPDEPALIGNRIGIGPLFARLMDLPDEAVMRLVAYIMGETLFSGSGAVELLGLHLAIDMADWWEWDEAFLEPLRDRQILLELVAEVAGSLVADANKGEKSKVLKQIIRDYLAGEDGRARTTRWVPRWMRFPPAAYTDRGGVPSVIAHTHTVKEAPPAHDVEQEGRNDDAVASYEADGNVPEEAQRLAA